MSLRSDMVGSLAHALVHANGLSFGHPVNSSSTESKIELIAHLRACCRDGPGRQLQYVSGAADKRARAQRPHRWDKMHHLARSIEEYDIDRETHPDGVNRLFAAKKQALARVQWRVT